MAQLNDASAAKSTPKDIGIMLSILKEMGIQDYEPRILNHMVEFTYKYVSNIIEEAQICSTHAKNKTIEPDDIKLAIKLHEDTNFINAPDREVISEMARQRNSMPLPLIKSSAGLRLPADRYSLTACNYRLKSMSKKNRTVHTVSRLNLANMPSASVNKGSSIASLNKSGPIASLVTKALNSTTPVLTKPISNIPKSVSSPIIKFSDGNRTVAPAATLSTPTVVSTPTPQPSSVPHILIPTVGIMTPDMIKTEIHPVKRKLEDDDYDE